MKIIKDINISGFDRWFLSSGLPSEARATAAYAWNAAIGELRIKRNVKKCALSRGYTKRSTEDTRSTATKNGEEWSTDEINVALDYSMSAKRAAKVLGRTFWAVDSIRKKYMRSTANESSPNNQGLPRSDSDVGSSA